MREIGIGFGTFIAIGIGGAFASLLLAIGVPEGHSAIGGLGAAVVVVVYFALWGPSEKVRKNIQQDWRLVFALHMLFMIATLIMVYFATAYSNVYLLGRLNFFLDPGQTAAIAAVVYAVLALAHAVYKKLLRRNKP